MKTRFAGMCQLMALTLLLCCCFSAMAVAQDTAEANVHARYVVIPQKPAAPGAPAGNLLTWNGSFTYNSHQYNFVMVGNNPSTGQPSIITTYIIPVKIVLSTGQTFDPISGGANNPLGRTLLSPIFDRSTTYTQGGVNVGTTQYVDAFQRANFWSTRQNEPNYHGYLGAPTSRVTVLPELTLNVPAGSGTHGTKFEHQVALVDINWYDAQVSAYMQQNNIITPAGLPIFESSNMYWT